MKRLIGFFLVAVAGGFVALGAYKILEKKQPYYSSSNQMQIPARFTSYSGGPVFNEPDFETAAAKSIHAVVHIKTEFQRKSNVYNDFFNFFDFTFLFRTNYRCFYFFKLPLRV